MSEAHGSYYVPERSYWPIIGAIGLLTFAWGSLHLLHSRMDTGPILFGTGIAIIIFMIFGWFATVIKENCNGLYDAQVDRSFRWGMAWFIFSEIMFFSVFFGALFYVREFSVPWLAGEGSFYLTGLLVWPDFQATWPLMINPDNATYVGPKSLVHAWGIPAINTAILLSSALTLTWAHWALKNNQRGRLIWGLLITIILGLIFEGLQAYEYYLTHAHYGLTLSSGIYGSTFFLITGFHAVHVIVGLLMLIVMLFRCIRGHFTPDNHFGFEAAAWYWHFVDVVWILLFVFVYWL